jgi:hypothetical protein
MSSPLSAGSCAKDATDKGPDRGVLTALMQGRNSATGVTIVWLVVR